MSALADLRQLVEPYEKPDDRQAWMALATSVPPYLFLWWLMYRALDVSYWLTLVLSVPAAGFLVRTFIVQHDCGHGSFFRSARLNVSVGRACSLLTLIPYGYWRRSHGTHHATSGKLAERGADIDTRTVREYLAMSGRKRLVYRLMRNPVVLFVIAPTLYFALAMRLPWMARATWRRVHRPIRRRLPPRRNRRSGRAKNLQGDCPTAPSWPTWHRVPRERANSRRRPFR